MNESQNKAVTVVFAIYFCAFIVPPTVTVLQSHYKRRKVLVAIWVKSKDFGKDSNVLKIFTS